MSLYQQEEDARLTVDFGGGRSLTLKMRGTDLDIGTVRRLGAAAKQSEMITERLKRLQERGKGGDLKGTEFDSVMDEVAKLNARGDQITMMVDFVFAAASGWLDNYFDRKAEERGEVLPFTRENIEKMGIGGLSKVVERLNGFFGFEVEPDAGNALTSLQQESLSAGKEFLYRQNT